MKRLEKERRLEIVKRESSAWKERREQRALQKVADDWLLEECLGVVICQAAVTISKICTNLVEDTLKSAIIVGEAREQLKKQKQIERIAKGKRKRDELLDELARRKRKELAAMRSLEARLGAWDLPKEAPASRKRTVEWYHWEGEAKRRKIVPCCDWENKICQECEADCDFMEKISDSLVYKMDPDNISTKYLVTTLTPLLKQAVLKFKQHQDNGDHKVCITTSAPQQHHVQSAWPSDSVEQNCDSAKKKESLSAQGGNQRKG